MQLSKKLVSYKTKETIQQSVQFQHPNKVIGTQPHLTSNIIQELLIICIRISYRQTMANLELKTSRIIVTTPTINNCQLMQMQVKQENPKHLSLMPRREEEYHQLISVHCPILMITSHPLTTRDILHHTLDRGNLKLKIDSLLTEAQIN